MTDTKPPTASSKAGYWLALAAILLAAALVRLHDYDAWDANPGVFTFDHEPVLLNMDGYRYLRMARDLHEGTYGDADPLRTAPEPMSRPSPPPLLPLLAAWTAKATGLPLVRTAMVLPVVLSLSLAAPLLLICRQLGLPRGAGLVAAAIALTWFAYVYRTAFGWVDTDCLILTFTLYAGALAYGAGASRERSRRAWCLLGAVCNAGLFAWWWDQAPEAVAAICLAPLLLSAALCYRPGRREARAVAGLAVVAAAACLAAWPDPVLERLRIVADVVHDGGGAPEDGLAAPAQGVAELRPVDLPAARLFPTLLGGFPNPAEDVAELQPVDFPAVVLYPFLLLCLGGLAKPLRRTPRAAAVTLLVPVLLTLSTGVLGLRALIFWAPAVGLSVASLMPAAGQERGWRSGSLRITGAAALIVSVSMVIELTRAPPTPSVASMLPAIQAVRAHTPEEAIVWTSWNHGAALMYYTGRRTIADGQFMEGERQVYANAPLAHPDEAVARRLMRFYAARGMTGMRAAEALAGSDGTGLAWLSERLGEPPEAAARALLEAVRRGGPEDAPERAPCASVDACRAFLFPERVPPVYVLLTRGILTTRWFRYGSWDRAKGASAPWALHVAQGAARSGDRLILGDGAVFDVAEGGALDLTMQGKTVSEAVGTLATHEGEVIREIDYGHPEGLRIDWKPEEGVATIVTANVGRSVFHRLFVRRRGDGDAFRPVAVDDPAVALWEVVARAAPRGTAGPAR